MRAIPPSKQSQQWLQFIPIAVAVISAGFGLFWWFAHIEEKQGVGYAAVAVGLVCLIWGWAMTRRS